ncbi:hypothetical protein [Alcaligenes sp. Marseille-Q7550]
MKHTSLFASLALAAGLLGGTAAMAQETAKTPQAEAATQQARPARAHKPLTAEQIKDVGPAYQRLKDAGYTKVGSIMQRDDKIIATVVDKDGKVLRVKAEGENGAFTPWEPKKDKRHHRRGSHDESKGEAQAAPAAAQVSS